MNIVKLEMIENINGVDFLIKNFSSLGLLTIKKLQEFALKRNGYFRVDLEQFGIKRKLNEKQIIQIFELLEIKVLIVISSQRNEESSIANELVSFGKYRSYQWCNVPLNYLEWICKENENKFAYEEIKRRKNLPLDIEDKSIPIGKYKGQKWTNVPSDYLEWILTRFEEKDEVYQFSKVVLNSRID